MIFPSFFLFLSFSWIFTIRVAAVPFCGLVPPKQATRNVHGTAANFSDSEDVLAAAWYPGWLGTQFPPNTISWSKYNVMTFAFAVTTADSSVISLDSTSQQVLPDFVAQAKQNNVNALVSIGGWTGSQYFSTAVATEANRTAFVGAVLGLVSNYNLDGIDFDWEYPNKQGIGCNTISPDDSANFLLFLQALRAKAPSGLIISAAVGITPFVGPDGTPMTDVSGFAKVLDHIEIMAYDIWGSWSSTVGPNAPLDDSCATNKAGSATSAVEAWTAAEFPANKIALGIAAYGHSFHVDAGSAFSSPSQLAPYPPFDKSQQPAGDKEDGGAGVDQCGQPVGVGGVFNFWGMIDGRFLGADGWPAAGIDYRFDNCSQTPYVYNHDSQVMISYDDATSFQAKGRFINEQGLRGFSMWHSAGDSNDILINAIHDAMGIEAVCS
ncbi:putative glycosyl hydrolase 18 family protein [Lyophyllum shimeji]|uniref:Glycosyl hydrolase 18 family protein n=1 Tax=Lyophyllum shimeji TaxID=47721 RepID=A0A9P3PNL2_LYOSH|nr:putative glycosyl hydrolase 18 family protein [Lyophyllum shimeji]